MPLFEYKCVDCGYKFEELVCGQPQVACPACQSVNVEKLFSAFSSGPASTNAPGKGAACNNFT